MIKKYTNSDPIIIAGPCCIEDMDSYLYTAHHLSNIGVKYIRAGLFKPRTSKESFQGLGFDGLNILKTLKQETDLNVVSEILDVRDVERIVDYVDIIQIGTRNMYNYPLLREVGKTGKTILLKRAFTATIDEWINAAQYIEQNGNREIILCERGIRSFDSVTRNLVDISCIPILKQKTDYRIILDPSHGTGRRDLIKPISMAGIMAGVDGLMIEVHHDPDKALCDGFQSLSLESYEKIHHTLISCYKYQKNMEFSIEEGKQIV